MAWGGGVARLSKGSRGFLKGSEWMPRRILSIQALTLQTSLSVTAAFVSYCIFR